MGNVLKLTRRTSFAFIRLRFQDEVPGCPFIELNGMNLTGVSVFSRISRIWMSHDDSAELCYKNNLLEN